MTLAENQNSTSTAKPAQSGVSVFSLDHFTSMQRMSPGVPLELCQGVTLSVLQDAAEGLLEINEAASAVSVSGKAAHELATVRAGEIIKTDVGRFVMVRHLQSMIIPRSPSQSRSAASNQVIILAQSRYLQESSQQVLGKGKPDVVDLAKSEVPTQTIKRNKIRLVTWMAAFGFLGMAGYATFMKYVDQDTPKSKISSGAVASRETAKSTIVKSSEAMKGETPEVPSASSDTPAISAAGSTESVPSETAKVAAPSAVDALRAASSSADVRKASKSRLPSDEPSAKHSGAKALTKGGLNAKDRQTVLEYKLEARFDRNSARIKLKQMAGGYPEGSAERAEVERAYNSL